MIAKQAQCTADETRRDSTAMKTIASLTILYLPSTFVATMFSTTFFTWGSNGNTLAVRTDIWKLIIIALVFTVLTIFIWSWLNEFGLPPFLRWASFRPSNVSLVPSHKNEMTGPRSNGSASPKKKRKIITYTTHPSAQAVNTAVGDQQAAQ